LTRAPSASSRETSFARAETGAPLRAAVVGVSTNTPCGVHDHAALLAGALAGENVSCSLHWLWRSERSIGAAAAEIRAWTRELAAELERDRPDAVLLHYSIFSYSYRGLPVFVPHLLSVLRRARVPLVSFLHEYAYPLKRGGARGAAWALSQRAVLPQVMRASTAVAVTVDFRAEWLASRRWLPKRPTLVAPVFSNLPPPARLARADRSERTVGLFGYSYDGAAAALVLDAMRLLQDRGIDARLVLLGAPGRSSSVGEQWLGAARERGITHPPTFSGTLAAQELSDAIAACQVLLSADPIGPTSRKTTLAASLASGSAVVALDGHRRWAELIRGEAAMVVEPAAGAVADALASLLADEGMRGRLGARGRAFAASEMSVGRSAAIVAGLLEGAVAKSRR
jgi:glycosyltransferase involved in cell wall biosynthesis